MEVKLTLKQGNDIVEDPQKAHEAGVKANDPWWVIVLKVLAYIIGLVLGGAATTSCSTMVMAMI